MTYEDRKKMESLSVKAFGRAQAYNKLYQKGYGAQMIEKMEDGIERKYKGTKYLTLEEIYNTMNEMIVKKEQEEAAKKAQEAQAVPEVKVEENV